MKNRSRSYNYGYANRYQYGSPSVPVSRVIFQPGFLTPAQKATLGPLRSALVRSVEDRRLFDMAALKIAGSAAKALRKDSARVVDSNTRNGFLGVRPSYGFAVPKDVAICVRRKERREVLLAKGKGGAGNRRPTRNRWSDVKC